MTNSLVQPSKALGYSDIYLDFVAGNGHSTHFYLAGSLEEVAGRLDSVSFPREALAAILKRQNSAYGVSTKALDAIDRLLDPRAVCVFAGQQAGFLGGPMYTIMKALAVVKAAARYEKRLGRPVLPIFWIAGDDHDFEEVNHATVLDRSGELVQLAYTTPPEKKVPISEIVLTDAEELAKAKTALRDALGETDFTGELYDLIDAAYATGETMVTAFGKLIAGLTRETGLILFCPGDSEVKKLARPFFRKIVALQAEIHDTLSRANRDILDAGYHVQVEKADNATHLFYNVDGRLPVLRDNDGFTVGDNRMSREELEQTIETDSERFSPDVITRPIFQSWLFPTLSQKGGPSEIAYLAQINPLFELFALPAPVHKARATATVVESRFETQMEQLGITFEELTGDIEQVVNRVLKDSFPEDLEQHFNRLRDDVEGRFKAFIGESTNFDPNLKRVAEQFYGKIDYTLKQFEGKVFASHKKKSQETRDRIYRVWHSLCPNRGLQERTLNVSYFISKYGLAFVTQLHDALDSEETSHQLIYLSRMH